MPVKPSPEAVQSFWQTFTERSHELAAAESAEDAAYDDCLVALQAIDEGLYLEFRTDEGANELIVTADGDRSLFPLVRELVEQAPSVPGWTVFALKPKLGMPEIAAWEEVEVPIDAVSFEPLEREGDEQLGLRLYVPGLKSKERSAVHNALLRAMDHALGEQAFAEAVGFTDLAALPEGQSASDFIALSELEAYLDWRRRQRSS